MPGHDLVLRDLVDASMQEGLAEALPDATAPEPLAGLLPDEYWCRIPLPGGDLVFRGRDGGALQAHRLSRGPVWRDGVRLAADAVVRALAPDEPCAADVAADVRLAVEHAAVTRAGWRRLGTQWAQPMLTGERIAATRNRPFHPTARAAVGWTAADLEAFGPMRAEPLGLDWLAVRKDRLRFGEGEGSEDLARAVLADHQLAWLSTAMDAVGVGDDYLPLPVHPWHYDHVLPREFASEIAAGEVVPVARGIGRFHPTSSLRTLITADRPDVHLKLPLGVTTLGAARLLPPRYLDNGDRAQRTMELLLDRDEALSAVALCDERSWCGWRGGDDEFADRPGQLAAQVRTYPALDDGLPLPMAALAAQEWDALEPALAAHGFADPVAFFGVLAEAFTTMTLGFLRNGVLPEVHGQNMVVVLADGAVRFVLRDHDTLRLYPRWMAAAGVPDPGYRIKPGAPQSLHLDSAWGLLGYAQTLGFQVNLYGIADAIGRHYGVPEAELWEAIRKAVRRSLDRVAVPGKIADGLLCTRHWPSRHVLGPLLRAGHSAGVSMPAGIGSVPNPLLVPARVAT